MNWVIFDYFSFMRSLGEYMHNSDISFHLFTFIQEETYESTFSVSRASPEHQSLPAQKTFLKLIKSLLNIHDTDTETNPINLKYTMNSYSIWI